jgi:hypothetical protein
MSSPMDVRTASRFCLAIQPMLQMLFVGLRQDDGGARVRRIPGRDGAICLGDPFGACG